MKRRISIILTIIIIVLVLCACSILSNLQSVRQEEKKELIELDVSSLGEICLISFDSDDTHSVLFYSNYYYETEDVKPIFYLSLFDIQKNELIKTSEFENTNLNGYNVDIDENKILLFNEQSSEMITYDLRLENRQSDTYDFKDNYEIGSRIESIDPNRFDCRDGFAVSTNYGVKKSLVFYDNAEKIYMVDNVYDDYNCINGHNLLVVDKSSNQTDKPESVLRVLDFDNQNEINYVNIPNSFSFNNVQHTAFSNKTITISTVNDKGKLDKIYLWKYLQNAKYVPFEDGFCEEVAVGEINLKIDEACNRIKSNYGVVLECEPKREEITLGYVIDNNIKRIEFYQSVLDLEYFISLLPIEVYQEITCKDIENPTSKFYDFRMYLVGRFTDNNVDAFASNYCIEETDSLDTLYIVYSCYGLNQRTFFHELMHVFEYRIFNYVPIFEENWQKLNPNGFEYSDNYGDVFYDEAHEEWQDYFARDYGMKNTLEDRATCFEEVCDGVLTNSKWWMEKPKLYAKQKYLAEVIKESFASLKDSKLLAI